MPTQWKNKREGTYDRQPCSPNQHQRKRQDQPDLGRDVLVRARVEALGAVAGMEEECVAVLDLGELVA